MNRVRIVSWFAVIIVVVGGGYYWYSHSSSKTTAPAIPVWESNPFKEAINDYLRTPSSSPLTDIPNCTGVKDGDYEAEGPLHLNGAGSEDYLVALGWYCGDPLVGGVGNGQFLVLQQTGDTFKNIGVLSGLLEDRFVEVLDSQTDGYSDIITAEHLDAARQVIHRWHWDQDKSMYEELVGMQNTIELPYYFSSSSIYYASATVEGVVMPGADPATFESIDNRDAAYAQDENHIYYNGEVTYGLDYEVYLYSGILIVDSEGRRTGQDGLGHSIYEIPGSDGRRDGACEQYTACEFAISVPVTPRDHYTVYLFNGDGTYDLLAAAVSPYRYTQIASGTYENNIAVFAQNPDSSNLSDLNVVTLQGFVTSTNMMPSDFVLNE